MRGCARAPQLSRGVRQKWSIMNLRFGWLIPLVLIAGGASTVEDNRLPVCRAVFCVAPGYRAEVGKNIPHSAWHDAVSGNFSGRLLSLSHAGQRTPLTQASFFLGARTPEGKFCLWEKKEMQVSLDGSGRFKAGLFFIQRAHAFPVLDVPQDCESETAVLIRSKGCEDLMVDVTTKWVAHDLEMKCNVQ